MREERHEVDNGEGWRLSLKVRSDPATLVPGRPPLLIVPGYGMNNFIFGYHPSGLSMEAFFVKEGFEVWSVNLRGQGDSRCVGGSRRYGFKELALVDLPRVLEFIGSETRTGSSVVDGIGCSLGASFLYIYLAHHPEDHRLRAMVSMGGPLRWENVHPAVRALFSSSRLVGAVPVRGTRKLARMVIPIAKKLPALASIYMNTNLIDLSEADQLVRTVDDPNRHLNREIARWIKTKDLIVDGVNVTHGMRRQRLPTLCVVANGDGIVPPAAALSVVLAMGKDRVDVLEVGDRENWFAHADLFISRLASGLSSMFGERYLIVLWQSNAAAIRLAVAAR